MVIKKFFYQTDKGKVFEDLEKACIAEVQEEYAKKLLNFADKIRELGADATPEEIMDFLIRKEEMLTELFTAYRERDFTDETEEDESLD